MSFSFLLSLANEASEKEREKANTPRPLMADKAQADGYDRADDHYRQKTITCVCIHKVVGEV